MTTITNIEFAVQAGMFLRDYYKTFEEAKTRAIECGTHEVIVIVEHTKGQFTETVRV